jgi:hypothetical protein
MTRYWIGVASHEHVQGGVKGGFAQVCHGKIGTLKYMSEDKKRWGFPFKTGSFEIPRKDFELIAKNMGVF